MQTEPKYIGHSATLGDLTLSFRGENWGAGIQDTRVSIGDSQLCWICWEEKEAFINELTDLINKYRI